MAKLNHHMGTTNDATNTRLAVVWKQNPQNPLMALVVKVDSIPKTVDRDMLLEMLSSEEATRQPDLFTVLQKKNLVKYYHDAHLFIAMPIDQIVMTPGDGRRIPLREIVNAVNKAQGLAPLPDASLTENISDANPYKSTMKEERVQDNNKAGVAKSLLAQARLGQLDVNKLLNKAFAMDYTLTNEWRKMFPAESVDTFTTSAVEAPKAEVVKTKKKTKPKTKKKTKKQTLMEQPSKSDVA